MITIEAVNVTPKDLHPKGISFDVESIVGRAAFAEGAFKRAVSEAKEGCDLTASLVVALTANRVAVPDTDVGEARAGLLGELHCHAGDTVASFRAEVEHFEAFDKRRGDSGTKTLARVVDRVATAFVQRLVGQVLLRGASVATVLTTLEASTHVGKLMEAELEAGERKLKAAIPHLIRLTGHEDPMVSMRAAAALGLLEASGDEVIRALVAMTRGPNIEKHLVAVNTLGDLKDPLAIRYLESIATGHPEEPIRQLAREAVKRAKGDDTLEVAP